ncbi:hypothetical protein D9619_009861 [Psilocybe cf. subviscida]|uniref:Transmembrane protein n=1 Tax=Psilocybe cf. subviscida TaxID=2480587 RepID=A0A8H5F676_9AGAR|nr:hypothetical protein D9619_009861 [Psilocybe cf. subviscida]
MHRSSTEVPTNSPGDFSDTHTEPVFAHFKYAIESGRDSASKLNEEILAPNVRALKGAAHPDPQVAIVIFLLSVVSATAFVVLSFLSVIGVALVAITTGVALVFIGAFASVVIKILTVASLGVVATVISPDAWQDRSLRNVLKHSRSIVIVVSPAVGTLLLRKSVGKLLRKLFRSNHNDFVHHPIRLQEIQDLLQDPSILRDLSVLRSFHEQRPHTHSIPSPADSPTLSLPEPLVSNPPPPSEPRDERVNEHVAQLKTVLSYAKRYLFSISEDVIKPSIKTFLETCDTNPRTAAIIATPAIIAFMVALTFLVLATLLLVLWTVISVLVGVSFVVVGAVLSLIFKLFIVVAATIPLAGIAGGLFVGANSAAQYILSKLPQSDDNSTERSTVASGEITERCLIAFERLWDGLVAGATTIVVLLLKAGQAIVERAAPSIPASVESQESEDDGKEPITRAWDRLVASVLPPPSTPSTRPTQQREHEAETSVVPQELIFDIPEASIEELPEDKDTVVVEPITIPDADPQASNKGLTRRLGFSTPQDEVDEPTI